MAGSNDAAIVERVRELYPPSAEMRAKIENDRRVFLTAMAEIKNDMILGVDKNIYVEPAIWTVDGLGISMGIQLRDRTEYALIFPPH